jgi:hypothetical protein
MYLLELSIGYILLALAEILPKYIKDEDTGDIVSFILASIAFLIFLMSLINIYK